MHRLHLRVARPALRGVVLAASAGVCLGGLLLLARGTEPRPLSELVAETVAAGPGRDVADYEPPSAAEARTVGLAVAALSAGAELREAPAGYRLRPVRGPAGTRPATALQEVAVQGTTPGHGMYVARQGSTSGVVVQVPHPVADRSTEDVGALLFDQADADLLMVAGAHRSAGQHAADVAKMPGSVFSAVDGSVVGPGTVVVQVHGFGARQHPASYGDVVLSSTVDQPSPLVLRLARRLRQAGFDVCVYEGERCAGLAGTRNVQARQARAVGADFVHLEISDLVRDDARRSARLVRELAPVLRTGAHGGGRGETSQALVTVRRGAE